MDRRLGICKYCRGRCASCNSTSDCLTCHAGFYGTTCSSGCPKGHCLNNTCDKDNGHCTFGCNDGFYQCGRSCFPCDSKCKTCYEGGCLECNDGFYQSGGTCFTCDSECKTCNEGGCRECNAGFHQSRGTCYSCDRECKICDEGGCRECNDGFYQSRGKCSPCNTTCRKCKNSGNNCLECNDGLYQRDGSCYLCNTTCRNCVNSSDNCIECNDGFFQSDGSCFPCGTKCRTCKDSGNNCLECKMNYYGRSCKFSCSDCKDGLCTKDRCINGCREGYYQEAMDIQCFACNEQCTSCRHHEDCNSCKDGYFGPTCDYRCRDDCNSCNKQNGSCTSAASATSVFIPTTGQTNARVTNGQIETTTTLSTWTPSSPRTIHSTTNVPKAVTTTPTTRNTVKQSSTANISLLTSTKKISPSSTRGTYSPPTARKPFPPTRETSTSITNPPTRTDQTAMTKSTFKQSRSSNSGFSTESSTPEDTMPHNDDRDARIPLYAGLGAGGLVLICVTVAVIIVYRRRSSRTQPVYDLDGVLMTENERYVSADDYNLPRCTRSTGNGPSNLPGFTSSTGNGPINLPSFTSTTGNVPSNVTGNNATNDNIYSMPVKIGPSHNATMETKCAALSSFSQATGPPQIPAKTDLSLDED